jgi:hypothetical protein
MKNLLEPQLHTTLQLAEMRQSPALLVLKNYLLRPLLAAKTKLYAAVIRQSRVWPSLPVKVCPTTRRVPSTVSDLIGQ